MSSDRALAELMDRLKRGDQDAAAEVFHLYAHRLIALARTLLESHCQAMLSGSDVAQEVLGSFFLRQTQDPYDLDSDSAVWGLLAEIALRKCGKWNRYFAARKRKAATRSLDAPPAAGDAWEILDPLPTPADAAVLTELSRGLKENERAICELRLQGYQVREIAAQLNLAEATVSRKLGRIKEKLQRLCASAE